MFDCPVKGRARSALATAIALTLSFPAVCEGAGAPKFRFNIPSADIAKTLIAFSAQSKIEAFADAKSVGNHVTRPVSGELTAEEALTQLLKGTGLHFRFLESGAAFVSVDAPPPRPEPRNGALNPPSPIKRTPLPTLDEVEIVGSQPFSDVRTSGHKITITRKEIERSGYVTLADAVRALPSDFTGGPKEFTLVGREARTNAGRGVGFNLRGLNSGATLILINGRRTAYSGIDGMFADFSRIPISAIEHFDIFPDGASAMYGADAVAGVVNFVLRSDFAVGESAMTFGTSARGGPLEYQFSHTAGQEWDRGSALISLEYYDRGRLPASTRSQAQSNLTAFGLSNFDTPYATPSNIVIGNVSYAVPSGQNGRGLVPADFAAGTQNRMNRLEGSDMLADNRRYGLVGSWRVEVSERLQFSGDVLLTSRATSIRDSGVQIDLPILKENPFYVNPSGGTGFVGVQYNFLRDLGPQTLETDQVTRDAAVGATLALPRGWYFDASISSAQVKQRVFARNSVNFGALMRAVTDPNPDTAFNPFGDGSYTNPATLEAIRDAPRTDVESDLDAVDIRAAGPIAALPGGEIKATVGLNGRREQIARTTRAAELHPRRFDGSRKIAAGFAHLHVPLIGPANRRRGLESLSFSVAARQEFSDRFDSTRLHQAELQWAPWNGITFRTSWSTAFRAPNLVDLVEDNSSTLFPLADPASPFGTTIALLWSGNNADLELERGESFTFGLKLQPARFRRFSADVNVFFIDVSNRVEETPLAADVLSNPSDSVIVIRNPTLDDRHRVCSGSDFSGFSSSCLEASIGAIVDARLHNRSGVRSRGLDLALQYDFTTEFQTWTFGLDGTYLFDHSLLDSPTSSWRSVLGTPSNPVDTRLRGSVKWHLGRWDATLSLNYTDDYRDTVSFPNRRVQAYFTVDTNVSYDLGNTQIALRAGNLFDRDPPLVNNPLGLGLDPELADLRGRSVSLTARKLWPKPRLR